MRLSKIRLKQVPSLVAPWVLMYRSEGFSKERKGPELYPPCLPSRKYTRNCNREGRSHFLALNTFHRRPLFERDHFCSGMLEHLPKICRAGRIKLEVATVLPDRIMMVLRPRLITTNLRTWLDDLKTSYCAVLQALIRPEDRRYLHCFRVRDPDGSPQYRFL